MTDPPTPPASVPPPPLPTAPPRRAHTILGRVTQAVREQNWFAVALELAIVVVGVFLGIQVSNWNAERIERTQERDLLVRLYEDVTASLAGQTRDLAFLDQQLADQAVILDALERCSLDPADAPAFERGIATLGFINPPRFFRRTVDEIAASGRTDILQSEAVRDGLSEIVALVEWRAQAFDKVNRTTEHHRFVIEDRVVYDLDRTFDAPFLGQAVGVDVDLAALCRDRAPRAAVSAVSFITRERRRAYAPILDRYRAFLPLVERELHDRWGLAVATDPKP